MEDTIKIELLTPLTGNFTSRELERQWEEGEYEYDVYEGLPLEGTDLSQYESEIKEAIEKYNAIGNEEGKPLLFLAFFFFLCFQCKLHPVTSQLIISIRYLDAHCLISFLYGCKDGCPSSGKGV